MAKPSTEPNVLPWQLGLYLCVRRPAEKVLLLNQPESGQCYLECPLP
jgi:hypothetical protein